jgi:hypothetical protein
MEWLKRLHILIAVSPWIAAIWIRQVWMIILCLAIHFVVITQWAILKGDCFLHRIENRGSSNDSELSLYLADMLQIPHEEFKQGVILINGLAPNFLHFSRLAGALGL